MKYINSPIVKEQMKYLPTPGAKQNGNTASNKEWIDFEQRPSVEQRIGYKEQYQDKAALELADETSPEHYNADEEVILRRDIGRNTRENQTLNTVSVNPRRNNTEAFVDYANVNAKYDPTVDESICRDGYLMKDLAAIEQDYTGQHHNGFYSELTREDKETGKSVTGFLYRNNYLNRI